MKLRPVVLLFRILLPIVCLSNKLSAQTTTSGALTGVVTDPSSAVVPDADVGITDIAKGATQEAKTDREGVFRFFFLGPGQYTLNVTRDGFQKESRDVTVLLGPPVTVNVTLELAKGSTTVKVTGEAPLIRAENGDVSATMRAFALCLLLMIVVGAQKAEPSNEGTDRSDWGDGSHRKNRPRRIELGGTR